MTASGNLNKTVHKITLRLSAEPQTFEMPADAQVVAVQVQHGEIALWFEFFQPSEVKRERSFQIAGTGHPVPAKSDYQGTVQTVNGNFVWHVYEVYPNL